MMVRQKTQVLVSYIPVEMWRLEVKPMFKLLYAVEAGIGSIYQAIRDLIYNLSVAVLAVVWFLAWGAFTVGCILLPFIILAFLLR